MFMTDTICMFRFPILELQQLSQFHQTSDFFCSSTKIFSGSFNKPMANAGQLCRHPSGAETVQNPSSGTASQTRHFPLA